MGFNSGFKGLIQFTSKRSPANFYYNLLFY